MLDAPTYPGARAAEREYDLDARGQRLRVYEWGDPAGRPVLLCHGYWDNAHGFDTLAPLLAADRRVVAFDARGHGESGWVDHYNWYQMVHDVVHVLEHVGASQPVSLIGHSYGGGLATASACIAPQWIDKLVNIDGFGPGTREHPIPFEPDPVELGSVADLRAYLDQRRRAPRFVGFRPYAELDQLLARRKQMNPRLSEDWLRYLCFHSARRVEEGWRWKADPELGYGAESLTIEWIVGAWRKLTRPMLAVVGSEQDSWGPVAAPLLAERLRHVPMLERATIANTGHFPHMEDPAATARLLMDYLAA